MGTWDLRFQNHQVGHSNLRVLSHVMSAPRVWASCLGRPRAPRSSKREKELCNYKFSKCALEPRVVRAMAVSSCQDPGRRSPGKGIQGGSKSLFAIQCRSGATRTQRALHYTILYIFIQPYAITHTGSLT